MRRQMERAEEDRVATYALRSADATRRYPIEDEGRIFDYRTHFQRDRDRIVYSRAFRRLRQKAQTGILPDYEDHRRNRLTHTLEVAQLARTIARALSLNEDLTEAVALGHDLGQPPFGPVGAAALDALLSGALDGRGGPGLGDQGGFSTAWQSLRVVDKLEKRYDHPGLNLTDAVREGLVKVAPRVGPPAWQVEGLDPSTPPSFEVQVVALADRIASALHDLDDAMQSGAVAVAQVERLHAVGELRKKLGGRYRARAGRFMKINAIHRGLTHLLVTGGVLASGASLKRWAAQHGVRDAESFRSVRREAMTGREIRLPDSGGRLLEDLEGFLENRVHRGFEADRVAARGRRVVLGLFAAYHVDPTLLDDHVLFRFKEGSALRYLRDLPPEAVENEVQSRYRGNPRFVRVLADHVAAMTDAYAIAEHGRLMEMGAVPIPSVEQLRRERLPSRRRGRRPADQEAEV
ncbi:MAG: HD domain-containing protein [Acidobacteriota bacterium]|nr:HD domain-containing protein [Acidobacteriota bacterium]